MSVRSVTARARLARGRGFLLALALALATAPTSSCAPNRPRGYTAGLAAGDRAVLAGRFREAAQAYDEAARSTERELDRDEATYRAGQAWRQAGDLDTAIARFEWLGEHSAGDVRQARGAFEAARMRLARGERERAEQDFLALARRLPTTGPAARGLVLVIIDRNERDPSGQSALEFLDRAGRVLAGTYLEPEVHFERAKIHEEHGRDADAAREYVAAVDAQPFGTNAHWDDAGYHGARVLRSLGRAREAVALADRVLGVIEHVTMMPGSYERPRFPELSLLRARILRDDLHDNARALRAYESAYADHPDSRFRDDALVEEAELLAQMGQSGRACDLYVRAAREFPCSRFGRRAREAVGGECHREPPQVDAAGCRRARERDAGAENAAEGAGSAEGSADVNGSGVGGDGDAATGASETDAGAGTGTADAG